MAHMSRKSAIPAFRLYGEAIGPAADMLHIEPIQSRSSRYLWEIDAHTHKALHQILWVASGPANIALDERRESCQGPVAVIIPPGVVHEFRFSGQTDGQVLTFNPRAVIEGDLPATGEALDALFAAPRILRFEAGSDSARRFAQMMAALADEFAAPGAAGSPVPRWLARAVVWQLADRSAREAHGGGRVRQALFTRFLMLVEAHHCEHWPLARYACELGLTAERLNRLTRAETGQLALELVHERLTREACRRLTYIAAPISKLAYELGFEDPAYFCRFFKRQTGQTPRDFRQVTAGGWDPS
jgi:AraC family transcriptional activator of pobA